MSQKGSSIGSDNPEFKYKKALLEIQKIHNANKVLKGQSEEMKVEYERQIEELTHSLHKLGQDYETLKHQKSDLQKYYDELQLSQNELRKEYNSLEREVSYLNEVLTQQNTELKKVSAFKDEKGLSTLINSYEDKEMNYRKDISRLEEINKNLKLSCETIETDLNEERRQRFKLQDLNNSLRMQITKYRELNNILLSKNQNIVATLLNRSTEGKEKYREAENMLVELSRQLEMVKSTRLEQQSTQKNMIAIENYEAVLHDKGKLETEILKLREKIQDYQKKQREGYEVQERMKRAVLKADQLQQQCNMLKGKLIVLETKDAMEGDSDFGDLKELQERILTTGPNDPLVAIKNSSDSSHFQLMKNYILDLKQKLSKALLAKKEVDRKYRSLKEKLTEKAEKSIIFEEQNKMLKGKLEGYQRLSERLQFQLQKNIEDHEEELNRMNAMTQNAIAKKNEEVKVANAHVRAQLDFQLSKFQKTEKGLRQELQTLKLELSTQKIKNADLQEKYNQTNQYLTIYQKKFNQITVSHEEAEENNQLLQENSMRFEQLYREQKSKNQSLVAQKMSLTNRIAELSDELDKKNLSQEDLRNKCQTFEGEAKRAKKDLLQAKSDIQGLENILKVNKKEMGDRSRVTTMDATRTDTSYYNNLEHNFNQERERNRSLEAEIQGLKLRMERAGNAAQRIANLENELNSKTNELNDAKRRDIETEKQINIYIAEIKGIQSQFDSLRRENMALKSKNMESGQELRRSIETKDLQSKRQIQRLNEELSSALSELREQKKTNNRMLIDNQSFREEISRLVNIIEEKKNTERNQYDELSQYRNNNELLADENDRLKAQIKYKNSTIEGLNNDINNTQERWLKLSQENSEIKIKKEDLDGDLSDLKREITGLKFYLTEIEEYANAKVASGNWQEQRDRDNVSRFVQRVKTILKKAELSNQQGSEARPTSFTGNSPSVPDYMKTYHQPLYNYQASKEVSYQDSPSNLNSGGNNTTFGALGGIGTYGGQTSFKFGDY